MKRKQGGSKETFVNSGIVRQHPTDDKFHTIEDEDGIVVYDSSDDYDPGEDEEVESEGFRLMTNEEIFTDEYMQDFADKMDAKIARENRIQNLISVCVILGCVLFILLLVYIFTGIYL